MDWLANLQKPGLLHVFAIEVADIFPRIFELKLRMVHGLLGFPSPVSSARKGVQWFGNAAKVPLFQDCGSGLGMVIFTPPIWEW